MRNDPKTASQPLSPPSESDWRNDGDDVGVVSVVVVTVDACAVDVDGVDDDDTSTLWVSMAGEESMTPLVAVLARVSVAVELMILGG
jgi:hypothetical protein